MKKLVALLLFLPVAFAACHEDRFNDSPIELLVAGQTLEPSEAFLSLKVAAVALTPSKADKDLTLERMEEAIRALMLDRPETQLIVFTEQALGWRFEEREGEFYQQKMADIVPGRTAFFLADLAQELDVAIALGYVDFTEDGFRLSNALLLVDAQGGFQTYRKRVMAEIDQTNSFEPGDTAFAADLGGVKVGFVLGEDVTSQAVLDDLQGQDLDLLVHCNSRQEQPSEIIDPTAMRLARWCLGVNRLGTEGSNIYPGALTVADPTGTIVASRVGREGFLYYEIPVE